MTRSLVYGYWDGGPDVTEAEALDAQPALNHAQRTGVDIVQVGNRTWVWLPYPIEPFEIETHSPRLTDRDRLIIGIVIGIVIGVVVVRIGQAAGFF